jgi:hypothetical protein
MIELKDTGLERPIPNDVRHVEIPRLVHGLSHGRFGQLWMLEQLRALRGGSVEQYH